jgi:tripeptidyl-peptidase-2
MVLSALKAEGIAYTPARVIKGIVATAKDVNGSPNVGLIQVEALHKYLVDSKDQAVLDADFDISIQRQGRPAPDFTKPLGQREGMRGVYLRQPEETSKVFDAICYVKPSFSSFAETEKMYGLDLKLGLASTDSWVRTPAYLSLASSGRSSAISNCKT